MKFRQLAITVNSILLGIIARGSFAQDNSTHDRKPKPREEVRYIVIEPEALQDGTGLSVEELRRLDVRFRELTVEELRAIERQIQESSRPQTNAHG